MRNTPRITLADIAAACGVSKMTVSLALRNGTGISEETRRRVVDKAAELGYRPDPALAALHRYRHNVQPKNVQAALAWLNTWPNPEKLRRHREFDLYWQGALDSAQQLGYRLEAFNLSEIPLPRLQSIFRTRNIQGILLPPVHHSIKDLSGFTWTDFAVVRFGQSVNSVKSHFVSSAQMINTVKAFERARRLGYERIGFVRGFLDQRHFTAGYLWAQNKLPEPLQLPLLKMKQPCDDASSQALLADWIQRNRPDAIITDVAQFPRLLNNLGIRVPDDIGLAATSVHDTPISAGIDQRPYDIGCAATRLLTALIAERNFETPEYCDEILIEGKWVDGSSLPPRMTA
ncbi:LacI family DNA-binding transcriptional regulator [Pontiella sp.]|uniref:LacI family DNA-binding transcriptional regulator n=1 Tax=Pontiella sp. TaxID=2837462 RepID=UPI00356A74E3